MTNEEKEKQKTDTFLGELVDDTEQFNEFISKLSVEFHKSKGQPFSIPRIEEAIRKVYTSYEILPPDLDMIQLEFEDLVNSNMVAIDNNSLGSHMRRLIGHHRMELYAR